MLLLSLIIAVFIQQAWGHKNPLHWDGWVQPWHQLIKRLLARFNLRGSALEFTLALALTSSVVIGLGYLLSVYSPLLFMSFASIVLLYSFGRGELTRWVSEFIVAEAKRDWSLAIKHAQILGVNCDDLTEYNWTLLNQRFLTRCSYVGFERFFAVVFWFVLLGPVGAFVYRFTTLWLANAYDEELSPLTPKIQLEKDNDIHYWLWLIEWPAIRALGLSYAITGNFSGCVHAWKTTYLCGKSRSEEVLMQSVLGALAIDESLEFTQEITRRELDALAQLQSRTRWCWLVIIAIVLVL